jgi:pheromone shutdown protein TraB
MPCLQKEILVEWEQWSERISIVAVAEIAVVAVVGIAHADGLEEYL